MGPKNFVNTEYQDKFQGKQLPPVFKPPKSSETSIFLVIVVHTFANSKISSKIVNVFESYKNDTGGKPTFFELGKTYINNNPSQKYNLQPNNLITCEFKENKLQSKIKKQNPPAVKKEPEKKPDIFITKTGQLKPNTYYIYKKDNSSNDEKIQTVSTITDYLDYQTFYNEKGKRFTIDFKNSNPFTLKEIPEEKVQEEKVQEEKVPEKPRVNNRSAEITSEYNAYLPFEPIVLLNNNECIFFYEYMNDETFLKAYYTKGSIFAFSNGIASTSCIYDYTEETEKNYDFTNDAENAVIIKNIILENNIFKEDEKKKEDEDEIVVEEEEEVVVEENTVTISVSDTSTTTQAVRQGKKKYIHGLIDELKEKCINNINILYANTILPSSLNDILTQKFTGSSKLFKHIINQLYINLTAPKNAPIIRAYHELYKLIYEYYYEKNNSESDKYDNELKKELKQFKNELKINEYIELFNEMRKKEGKRIKYESAYFSMHIFDFLDFYENYYLAVKDKNMNQTNNSGNEKKYKDIHNVIYNILNRSFITQSASILKSVTPFIKKELEKNTKGVYTYLKISNFQENGDSNANPTYNERFKIKLQRTDQRSIVMEYSNMNFRFYKGLNVDISTIQTNKKAGENRIRLVKETIGGEQVEKAEIDEIYYDNKYVFGNFNKIFAPKYTVKQIADEMFAPNNELITKVANGNPLFLMGWGASGSGKTSSLIYFIKNKEPGVLIHLSNKLAKEHGYITIELTCKELFQPYYENNANANNNNDDNVETECADMIKTLFEQYPNMKQKIH